MLSFVDMGLIGVVALLVFGPDQLPKVARRAGQIIRDVQNTSQSFIREMERAADEHELPAITGEPYAETPPASVESTSDAIIEADGPLTAAPAYHEAPVAEASLPIVPAELPSSEPYVEISPPEPGVHSHPRESPP